MIIFKKRILYQNWICEWLKDKKNYVKESTYANYSNHIFNHIIPMLGKYYLEDITHKIIQDFLLALSDNKKAGLSLKTIKDIANIIKSSLKKAMSEKYISYIDLTFAYPNKKQANRLYVLSYDEQVTLTNYLLDNMNYRNLGILLSLYLGLRIGEVCALKWEDVDFKKGTIVINKTIQRIYIKDGNKALSKLVITSPKTINANRDIPLSKDILNILKEYVPSNLHSYLISGKLKPIEPRSYSRYFSKLIDFIGLKHFKFHTLRHTFATNCISAGTDYKTVSELLGHASVDITLNLYVHPRLSQKQKCIETICKVLKGKVS